GVDVDEGEAVKDVDVVDRLLGQDGALAQGPAQVLLCDAAALAAVDEELDRLGRGAAVTVALRLRLALVAVAAPRSRRVLGPLLGGFPLADSRLHVALDAADLVAFGRRDQGDRATRATDPPGAADSVHVDLRGGGDVVVDHVGDVLDVEPAG